MEASINISKDADVIVIKEVGEVREIIQFKNYPDFLHYESKRRVEKQDKEINQ